MKPLRLLAALLLAVSASAQKPQPVDPTPRLGILIPKGPVDYSLFLDALHNSKLVADGPFTFRTGTISDIPVVLIIQPTSGEVMRALGAITMIHDFNLRALLYPGTSGGHLAKGQMAVADIVLGAKNVDYANYYLAPDGHIEAGEFNVLDKSNPHYGPLYADPALLSLLACSAHQVAANTKIPTWFEPVAPDTHPQIFYYGIQGTTTIWSDNQTYTSDLMKVFHAIDEDGDWYSNLAATMYKVPFIEVSTISNSIFAYPGRDHGSPAHPAEEPDSHIFAQRISNRIMLDLIARYGKQILSDTYTTPTEDPFPTGVFNTPRDPKQLLQSCK